MSKNLVIVESPAKAKTIEGFLGKDFVVKSSYGHVRDLKKKGLAVDVENGFAPEYEVSPDKKKVIDELKKLVAKSEKVWLATDEDREGEAISWHLEEVLDLKTKDVSRIVFHEITKGAITKAIENPRALDYRLVDAQQARRVLDRLVGFELSPVLWRKVKPSLSAGRVQSVTVRLIVEREREINNHEVRSSYRVTAVFSANGKSFKAELNKRFDVSKDAQDFVNACNGASFSVDDLQVKPAKKSPAAPFTTSTLQQEASRKLSFSVARTMSVAQKLYEEGKITYMRTDSLNLSDTARSGAKAHIVSSYGADYSYPRQYSTKSKGAQEAHEAIRPADMSIVSVDGDPAGQRLYDLIFKRTLASQMADAQLEKTRVKINIDGVTLPAENLHFVAKGEVIKFDGFLKVYLEGTDDEDADKEDGGLLPPMSVGDSLERRIITATQRFTNHPPRYTEASLVKKLEELGIGRPSTYAPTISTVQKRGYVVKEDREGRPRKYEVIELEGDAVSQTDKTEITGAEKQKLFPTDIGIVVNDFLVQHFEKILSYDFTANVEKQFDDIADGMMEWTEMIKDFYKPFHETVEDTLEHGDRPTGRELGKDPKTGKTVYAKIGRYGPMIQIGDADDEEKPTFASLRHDQSMTTIGLEEALELFKLPREVGEFEGEKVTAAIGRFGPYLRHRGSFVSLKADDGDDPHSVEIERAIELIEAKRKADAEKIIKLFEEDETVQVLKGRWGPYLKAGKKNIKIPKDIDPQSLTFEDCQKLIEEAPAKKGRGASRARKSTAKKK
ncbi:MAG: type I DNA topoisomerase [Flavobacteriales bacterium]|nr:type I DNA topoisomerase [Flavobacteriales bacterium]